MTLVSCNFWDSNNNRIGLNLASGVNESFGNENCLWVNGVLYPLSDVLFQHQDEGHWTIRSLDEKLNLDVKTGWRRYENLNLRLVLNSSKLISSASAIFTIVIQRGFSEFLFYKH